MPPPRVSNVPSTWPGPVALDSSGRRFLVVVGHLPRFVAPRLGSVAEAGVRAGATESLTASTELEDHVRRVVAFNTYDYSKGVGRANRVALIYAGSARFPTIGRAVTSMENKPVLGLCAPGRSGRWEQAASALSRRTASSWPRHGYPRVAREVFRNVDSMIAARALYGRVMTPVTLIDGDHDWSRIPDREANLALLRDARPRRVRKLDRSGFPGKS